MTAQADRLANEILDTARNQLLVRLRYMSTALGFFERETYGGTMGTDGRRLFYQSVFILKTYQDAPENMVRLYLHTVLHCVFLHPFTGTSIDRRRWDLACDIAVENSIEGMRLSGVGGKNGARRQRALSWLRGEIPYMTAEKIYAWLGGEERSEDALSVWESVFSFDDHTLWYAQTADAPERKTLQDFWRRTAGNIQLDLESFSRQQGTQAGDLIQNLYAVTREKHDYADFLHKFSVLGEAMKVNDDEFDYIYYTYGLTHYHDMPLIEPLEYKEVKRIREFVIAIDTSDSVRGEEVQGFLQKTYNILMQEDSYFSRVNIHIIQCDADIREDAVITGRDDFEAYLKRMKIRGLGGTDFRPVFRYVNQLIEENVFSNLKGLIYFTDGYGTFPEKKPPYATAFIFTEEGYELPEVPPWAIRLALAREDL